MMAPSSFPFLHLPFLFPHRFPPTSPPPYPLPAAPSITNSRYTRTRNSLLETRQVKTNETDGYTAVQVAYQPVKAKNAKKPEAGHLKKAGIEQPMRHLMEYRVRNRGCSALQLECLDIVLFKPRSARREHEQCHGHPEDSFCPNEP